MRFITATGAIVAAILLVAQAVGGAGANPVKPVAEMPQEFMTAVFAGGGVFLVYGIRF